MLTAVLLNANGREIGGYDSQSTKFAARELVARGTLTLDRVVELIPRFAERPAFARTVDGHYRSAYPVLPSILAAGPAWALAAAGLLDLEAPLAPTIIAKLSASLLVTFAVVFAFIVASQRNSTTGAALVAIGYGPVCGFATPAVGRSKPASRWTRSEARCAARWAPPGVLARM